MNNINTQNPHPSRARVLTIAGVDPSGGAGILADVKSFSAFGAYSMAAVAALTAQNTTGVSAVQNVDPSFLREQLEMISSDINVDSVKIGLLGNSDAIEIVTAWIEKTKPRWIVLDPVMVATSSDRLLEEDAELKLKELAKFATIVTPNLPELAVWLGEKEADSIETAIKQAKKLQKELNTCVLLKTGHLQSKNTQMPDFVVTGQSVTEVIGQKVETQNTHGTGCSLSSAIAAILPQIEDVVEATKIAKNWLTRSLIQSGKLLVGGKDISKTSHGPIDHLQQISPVNFSHFAQILTSDIENRISQMPFIVEMVEGTLESQYFAHYLQQDNIYLQTYRDCLIAASEKAPTGKERVFFNKCAEFDLEAEIAFHNVWLERNGFRSDVKSASNETKEYCKLLSESANEQYPVLLAALQPCFWIYALIGKELGKQAKNAAIDLESHPFGTWIKAYSDQIFQALAEEFNEIINQNAKEVDDLTWRSMIKIYRSAAEAEFDFFAQKPC